MKLFLVGFMGAGKTTIGREAARRLDIPFFDLDELIESAEGTGIKEIFAAKGEPYFRKRERDILRSTHYVERGVVATGGGTFTFEENIEFVRSEGLSVFLSAPYSVLRGRIADKAAERPLFRDDIATHELFASRLPSYRRADLTLDLKESQTMNEVVERLLLILPREFLSAISQRRWSAT